MPESTPEHNPAPPLEPAEGRPTTSGPMGQYYLLEKIAQGGMAEIYKGLAYDLHGIKRTVVIKKILPQAAASKEFIDMLVAEAKIAVMLSQGNIAQIYDLGKSGDDYFIVMEYVEGRSISQILKQCVALHQLPPVPIVCHTIAEIAAGLDYMHRRTDEHGRPLHIVHRDVSPQNVIVTYAGTVKIIDFGIAKARTKLETTDIGILKGKFAYMSPEQAEGNPIDHRSDIFSLGVILHEMLTGQRLFKAKENRETLRNVRRAMVPAPSSIQPGLSAELDQIVFKALAKHRDERYQFAADLRHDLLRLLHQHYPDFRPTELVDFMQALFRNDRKGIEEHDEGGKTPLLIIDHTQSAIAESVPGQTAAPSGIAGRAPPIVAEYLLSMEEPKPSQLPAAAGPVDEVSEISLTPALPIPVPARTRSHRPRRWIIAASGVIIIGGSAFLTWRSGYWSLPPSLIQRFTRHPLPAPLPEASTPVSAPTPIVAELAVHSTPDGAQIYLDDRATPYRTPSTIPGLTINHPYTIGLFREGYKFWSTQWNATAAGTYQLEAPLAIDYGGVELLSIPAGAQIVLNGKVIGHTPLTRTQMMPGEVVTIEIAAEGYQPARTRVMIRPGKTETVRTVLQRSQSSTRPDATRENP